MSKNEIYDAIVVGSGASGGWAAKELTERGLKVLLLDAGPVSNRSAAQDALVQHDQDLAARQPVQSRNRMYKAANRHLYVDDISNPYTCTSGTSFNWIRSRQLGGRTLLWPGNVLRMSDRELQATARDGYGDPWPIAYEDIAPYYDRVERFLHVIGPTEDIPLLPGGRFRTAPRPTAAFHWMKEQLAREWPALHLTHTPFVPKIPVGNEMPTWDPQRSNQTSLHTTIAAAERTGRLNIRPDSVVRQIEMDSGGNRAKGIVFLDRKTNALHLVVGRTILLCASALESVRILLNSADTRHPAGLGNSSGFLGRCLMDHFGGTRLNAQGTLPESTRQGGNDVTYYERIYIPAFQIVENSGANFIRGYGVQGILARMGTQAMLSLEVFGETLPRAGNGVRLNHSVLDDWGIPTLEIDFAYAENELEMSRHADAFVSRIMDIIGFKTYKAQRDLLAPGTRAHEIGGARMGSDASKSVLNRFNQLWEAPNVFVLDGASFVSAGCQNPTLTIMALAVRACDFLAEELGRGNL